MKKINLDAIRIDGGTQPRERINMEVVQEYAEAIKGNVELPPVVVFFDGADRWLADGFHRWHAHKQAEKASIAADERAGSLLDALLYAVGANGTHGLPRSNADKRKAVEMVLTQDAWATWPETKIAEACRVSRTLVRAVMEERHLVEKQDAVRTVTRGGTTYRQDTSRIGKAQRPADPSADAEKPAQVATVATYPQDVKQTEAAQVARGKTTEPKKTTLPPAPAPERGQTLPPDDDQLAEAQHAINDLAAENEELRDRLAVEAMDASEDEKTMAAQTIAELRARVKTLEAENAALKVSRDTYQREASEAKKDAIYWRKQADKLGKVVA